jgi:hypothetical protein
MRHNWIWKAVFGLSLTAPLFAQPYTISSPTAEYLANTTLIPVTGSNLSSVPTLTGGGRTITFSPAMMVFTHWSVWGAPPDTESSTPLVLASTITNQTSETLTISASANTVGFEIEPSNACSPMPACSSGPSTPFTFTVTFLNGTTTLGTVTRSIFYNAARLIAVSSSTPITTVQISVPAAAGGFALAQFRFGTTLIGAPPASGIPTLGAPALSALALLLLAAGALQARSQQVKI